MVQLEDVHFKAEIMVPKPMIGRIIGKGGQHVSSVIIFLYHTRLLWDVSTKRTVN